MRRIGLSPRNYAKIHLVEEQTNTLIKDMLTAGTDENVVALLTQAGENAKAIDTMTQAAGESMVAQQQATTTAILQAATGITRLEAGVGRLAGFMAQKEISGQIKRESDEDLREERELFRANEFINGTTARHPRGVLRGDYEKTVCLCSYPAYPVRGAGLQPRKGLEGCAKRRPAAGGAGARKRGAPESPVFCEAKNAPKFLKKFRTVKLLNWICRLS